MGLEAALRQLLVARAGATIIGVGVDADPATGCEEPRHLDVLRVHHADQILHDDIDAVLVEGAVVAEGEEVDLQRLTLHHPHVGDVADPDLGKVRLPRDRAEAGKLRAIEADPVVVVRVLIDKRLQHRWIVVLRIVRIVRAEQLQPLLFSLFVSMCCHKDHSLWGKSSDFISKCGYLCDTTLSHHYYAQVL